MNPIFLTVASTIFRLKRTCPKCKRDKLKKVTDEDLSRILQNQETSAYSQSNSPYLKMIYILYPDLTINKTSFELKEVIRG